MSRYSLAETRRQLFEVPNDLAAVVASVASMPRLTRRPLLLSGSGDSHAAACMAAASVADRQRVQVVYPWELSTEVVVPPPDATVVLISASGNSDSIVDAAHQLVGQAARTVAVTGAADSPLARASDDAVTWSLGPVAREPSPAVRTFASTHMALLALLDLLPPEEGWLESAEPALGRVIVRSEELAAWLVDDEPAPPNYVGTGADRAAAEFARAKSIEISGVTAVATDPDEWFHVDRHGAPPFGPVLAATGDPRPPRHVVVALHAALTQGRRVVVAAPSGRASLHGAAVLSTAELPTGLRPWGLALLGVAVGLRQAELLGRGPFVLSPAQD